MSTADSARSLLHKIAFLVTLSSCTTGSAPSVTVVRVVSHAKPCGLMLYDGRSSIETWCFSVLSDSGNVDSLSITVNDGISEQMEYLGAFMRLGNEDRLCIYENRPAGWGLGDQPFALGWVWICSAR